MGTAQSKINAATGAGGAAGGGAVLYAMSLTIPSAAVAVVVGTVVGKAARVVAKAALRSRAAGSVGVAAAAAAGVAASVVAGPVGVVVVAAIAGSTAATVTEKSAAVSTALCVVGDAVQYVGAAIVRVLDRIPFSYIDVSAKTVLGLALGWCSYQLFPGYELCAIAVSYVASPFVNWVYEELTGGRNVLGDPSALTSHAAVCAASVGSIVYVAAAPGFGVVWALYESCVWASSAVCLSTLSHAGAIAFYRAHNQFRYFIMNKLPLRALFIE